jgi:hypothetical protein
MWKGSELSHELLWALPEGKLNPARGSEKVRDKRKRGSLHVRKQKRRSATLNDTAMYLGDF